MPSWGSALEENILDSILGLHVYGNYTYVPALFHRSTATSSSGSTLMHVADFNGDPRLEPILSDAVSEAR